MDQNAHPPENRSCFVCWHFDGVHDESVVCAHPKPPMLHAHPALGCTKRAVNPAADQAIATVAQWRASLPHLYAAASKIREHNGVGGGDRRPLTDEEVRSAHFEHPTRGTRVLAWEIYRLQGTVVRVRSAIQAIYSKQMSADARTALRRVSAWLTEEPGVRATIAERIRRERSRYRDR